jgi:ElaB/YqjD/DUF883 family membrane-anchored ribosome-binding protein
LADAKSVAEAKAKTAEELGRLVDQLKQAGDRAQQRAKISISIRELAAAASSYVARPWFGIPRLAWGGVLVLVVGFGLFATLPRLDNLSSPREGYVAEVLTTKTGDSQKETTIIKVAGVEMKRDPKVKATVDSQKDVTIIKLEGLRKLPTDSATEISLTGRHE